MRLMKRVQSKNKRYFIYEAIFIILAFLVRNKGILADEGILEKINIAKQCFDVALSIVLSLFAGMLLVYKNRISIVISMIRFVNKILFLLIVLEILVSDDISGMKMWGMGFLLLVSMLAASVSLRKNKKYKDKTEPGEKLYHSREEQRNQLVKKIREDDDMETICVSAPWGSGKTFFIEKVCDELDEYPILTINAMDMEDQQKLYQYVLNCISELLDERGYYTGFNSEWHKYVSAFSKVLFGKNDLLNQIFSAGASDYRNQKIVLNEIFEKAFKEQKLVIIVDDLERCKVEKAKQYLQFIKEISTFPRTMVIFLADYQKLISNEIITQEAANKFITEIMVLREASCDEIQQELKNKYDFNMDKEIVYFNECFESDLRMLQITETMMKTSGGSINSGETEKKKARWEKAEKFFRGSLANPRNYIAIAGKIEERKRIVDTYVEDKQGYLNWIQATHQIFIISWMQVVMSDEFTKLFEIGVKKYVENNLYEPLSEKTYALSVLTEHLWGRNEQYRYDDYQVEQRYIFADHILQCSSSISEDVVSYRTDDEKCIYDAEHSLPLNEKYEGYLRIRGILGNGNDTDMDTKNRLVRKTIAQMKESLHRKQLVHELMNLCDNRVMINHQPPCTLFSDVYGVLKEMDGSDIMGAQGWKNQLLTAQVYYYNMSGWKTMRTYRDAWMENSSDIDARLEWDTEDKIQHAIDCLKNELCEAEQILIANEAIAYPDVHKIILNCEIGIKQMQALLEIRKLLENNDSKQMMGEKEVLNILDEILNSFCTEKNRVRWDFDEIKVCINAVEKMDNPSIALQSVEKLHEIVTYISRLNPEWKYIALLRSRLFALQKKLQKEVK